MSSRRAFLSARPARGFTLLEVMVAVALLAVGMSVLLQVQARSALMAEQAKDMTVATQLARGKLFDCQQQMLKRGFSEADFKEEGRFDEEGYDDVFWECHGYKPDLPMPDASDFTDAAAQGALGGGSGEEGALGGLSGLAGGMGQDPAMAGMGMGMIAPVLGQISEVVGDSIRELVVIVRWKSGEVTEEMRVATHLVDPTGVRAMAQQLGAMSQGLQGLTGGGGIPGMGGGQGQGGNNRGGGSNRGGANNRGGGGPTGNLPAGVPSNFGSNPLRGR